MIRMCAKLHSYEQTPRWRRAGLFCLWISLSICCPANASFAAKVKLEPWGTAPDGQPVSLYTVQAGLGRLQVTDYGARIVGIHVPDRAGTIANVVLTRDTPAAYTGGLNAVMGATLGRYANRIGGAQIEIDGVTSSLAKSNGPNTLHGGPAGFNTKVWRAKAIRDGVEMTLVSPDDDMGFPGVLTTYVSFRLVARHGEIRVEISYLASTTRPTVVNLTNHAFFNLSGAEGRSVYGDLAMIAADSYTPVTAGLPTGAIDWVAGTPFDFRGLHPLGAQIPERGYDNNFVLRSGRITDLAAQVDDPASGRTLRVYTTEPGIQLFVPPSSPPLGAPARYPPVQAFCLETQHFPDSPHHANFPTTTLRPSKIFRSQTIYSFTAIAQHS